MQYQQLQIPEVFLITPDQIFNDQRGMFFESHRMAEFHDGVHAEERYEFVQGNISRSSPWTLRGLHYQDRYPQGKLIRCLQGAIYDICVDVRKGSPTFGRHVGRHIDDKRHQALWVPPGFAHGFLSLDNPVLVTYECTTYYNPAHARVISWDDSDLGIIWPLRQGQQPILSQQDRARHPFKDAVFCEYQPTSKRQR